MSKKFYKSSSKSLVRDKVGRKPSGVERLSLNLKVTRSIKERIGNLASEHGVPEYAVIEAAILSINELFISVYKADLKKKGINLPNKNS